MQHRETQHGLLSPRRSVNRKSLWETCLVRFLGLILIEATSGCSVITFGAIKCLFPVTVWFLSCIILSPKALYPLFIRLKWPLGAVNGIITLIWSDYNQWQTASNTTITDASWRNQAWCVCFTYQMQQKCLEVREARVTFGEILCFYCSCLVWTGWFASRQRTCWMRYNVAALTSCKGNPMYFLQLQDQ